MPPTTLKVIVFFSLLVAACGGQTTDSTADRDPGEDTHVDGKADHAQDGTETVCSFDIPFDFERVSELEPFISDEVRYDRGDLATIPALHERQIIAATAMLFDLPADATLDDALESVDMGEVHLIDLELDDGTPLDWVRTAAGDNEVGVVFADGTELPVAEVGDGELIGCGTVSEPPTREEFSCRFDLPFADGIAATDDLESHVVETIKVEADDVDALSETQASQIYESLVYLTAIVGDEEFGAVFDAADDGVFFLRELEIDAVQYDWVKLHSGDTEVGVVFVEGTLEIAAEVSDSDVLGCEGSNIDPPQAAQRQ